MTDTTNIDTETETGKRKVAEHWYTDAAGNTVESEDQATGIGYKLLSLPDQPFVYQIPDGAARLMLAVFGAKTLATNVTSGVRQKSGDDGAAQRKALADRFALIETGVWMDSTREGGVQLDLDVLAQAVVNVRARGGKTDNLAEVRAKLENKDNVAKIRGNAQYTANTEVLNEYAALKGRPKVAADLDDLLA